MKKNLCKQLDLLRKEFLDEFGVKSYFAINNGLCFEFSSFVYDSIGKEFNLEELATFDLFKVDEDGDVIDDVFDEELILQHINNTIPLGLTITQLNALRLVPHLCLTDWSTYYDAECIEGVSSFFDLPLYKREFYVLEKYLKETNNLKNGVIANANVSLIYDYNKWRDNFFKFTGEFNCAEDFWRTNFPELFIDTQS